MEKITDFFRNSYGFDSFSCALMGMTVLLDLVAVLLQKHTGMNMTILAGIGLISAALVLFRTFSGNHESRRRENDQFLYMIAPIFERVEARAKKREEKKIFKFFKCPACHKELRVPRGKGRIEITCPGCGEKFIRTS